jgi:hypothetical protein
MHRPFKTFADLLRRAHGLAGKTRTHATAASCGCSGLGGGR